MRNSCLFVCLSHHHDLTNDLIDLKFGTHMEETPVSVMGYSKVQNSEYFFVYNFFVTKNPKKRVFCQFLASKLFSVNANMLKISMLVERNAVNRMRFSMCIPRQ